MPVPNPRSILKPEVVFWAFLRMRSEKIAKTPLECRFGVKFPYINDRFWDMPVPNPRSITLYSMDKL